MTTGTRAVRRAGGRYPLPFVIRWGGRWAFRLLTSGMRALPDFVIIGAQRCGTTSLYNYLAEHPNIWPAFVKETHFLDRHFGKGLHWYRAYFPLVRSPLSLPERGGRAEGRGARVTGESTPYYLFYPHAPKRLRQCVPEARLIALLRNPVDRAYSHYHHEVSIGAETARFEEALEREQQILPVETARVLEDVKYNSFGYAHYSYLARGVYVDQLQHWSGFFGRERMLIIKSEDLYSNPGAILKQVLRFLDLPDWTPPRYEKYNLARYSDMDAGTRKRLSDYFALHNQRLYEYLGVEFGWD